MRKTTNKQANKGMTAVFRAAERLAAGLRAIGASRAAKVARTIRDRAFYFVRGDAPHLSIIRADVDSLGTMRDELGAAMERSRIVRDARAGGMTGPDSAWRELTEALEMLACSIAPAAPAAVPTIDSFGNCLDCGHPADDCRARRPDTCNPLPDYGTPTDEPYRNPGDPTNGEEDGTLLDVRPACLPPIAENSACRCCRALARGDLEFAGGEPHTCGRNPRPGFDTPPANLPPIVPTCENGLPGGKDCPNVAKFVRLGFMENGFTYAPMKCCETCATRKAMLGRDVRPIEAPEAPTSATSPDAPTAARSAPGCAYEVRTDGPIGASPCGRLAVEAPLDVTPRCAEHATRAPEAPLACNNLAGGKACEAPATVPNERRNADGSLSSFWYSCPEHATRAPEAPTSAPVNLRPSFYIGTDGDETCRQSVKVYRSRLRGEERPTDGDIIVATYYPIPADNGAIGPAEIRAWNYAQRANGFSAPGFPYVETCVYCGRPENTDPDRAPLLTLRRAFVKTFADEAQANGNPTRPEIVGAEEVLCALCEINRAKVACIDDTPRAAGLGKYEGQSAAIELVDCAVGAGYAAEECGDADGPGYYARIGKLSEEDVGALAELNAFGALYPCELSELTSPAGFIVKTDSNGFCDVTPYETPSDLAEAWKRAEEYVGTFYEDDDSDDDSATDEAPEADIPTPEEPTIRAFVAKDGADFCAECARGENDSDVTRADLSADCPDDAQWLITGWDSIPFSSARAAENCAHCGNPVGAAKQEPFPPLFINVPEGSAGFDSNGHNRAPVATDEEREEFVRGAWIGMLFTAGAYSDNHNSRAEFGPGNVPSLDEKLSATQAAEFRADCAGFLSSPGVVAAIRATLADDWRGSSAGFETAGTDFHLTRNGHGAGFWDGAWDEPAKCDGPNPHNPPDRYGSAYRYAADYNPRAFGKLLSEAAKGYGTCELDTGTETNPDSGVPFVDENGRYYFHS